MTKSSGRLSAGRGLGTSWKRWWRITPVLLVLALAGCGSLLHSDVPTVQVYTLRAASTPSDSADPPVASDASLRVAHPLAGPGLGTSQIVLRQPDNRLNVYAASAWAADAPALLESLAVETLRASGHWRSVEDAESPFPADYLLQISIRSFDADYSGGTDAAPTVRVTLDCTLGKSEGRDVVATFVASGSAAASANRLGDVVAAFQQATDAAMASLSRQACLSIGAKSASCRTARPIVGLGRYSARPGPRPFGAIERRRARCCRSLPAICSGPALCAVQNRSRRFCARPAVLRDSIPRPRERPWAAQ